MAGPFLVSLDRLLYVLTTQIIKRYSPSRGESPVTRVGGPAQNDSVQVPGMMFSHTPLCDLTSF